MQRIKLDDSQKEILKALEGRAKQLNSLPDSIVSKIFPFFKSNKLPKGMYLYGGVGIGKTMLMQQFFNNLTISKEMIHYQSFMHLLHVKLHKLQGKSADKIIQNLATDIAMKAKVVCIDEFEIKDITDAMIIMHLFKYLLKKQVFIVVTTNIRPDDLYKDGLQRESFLPFITMIKQDFQILHLASDKDYRFTNITALKQRVIYPVNQETTKQIQEIKNQICPVDETGIGSIKIFGRDIEFKHTHQNILFTDFSELFTRSFSYADYVNICQHYKIIVIENIRKINEDETDIITRFINFIDNAYFYKVQLFITLEHAPDEIYLNGKKSSEFQRTISRLNEMNSSNYIKDL